MTWIAFDPAYVGAIDVRHPYRARAYMFDGTMHGWRCEHQHVTRADAEACARTEAERRNTGK